MTPKVVYANQQTGMFLYWCPKLEQQVLDQVCQQKHFKKSSNDCRLCLGKTKRTHWEEPWASLGEK